MMNFRILPLALALAAMAGAASAQSNNRFDGTWEGILRDAGGNCPTCPAARVCLPGAKDATSGRPAGG